MSTQTDSSSLSSDFKEIVAEQYEYRELLYQITLRDLKLRYKQTVMGFGWAVFMPLLNTAMFSVIFTRVAPIETPVPYPLFAFCGLAVWNFFASSVKFAANSLSSNVNLVAKVYFPKEIFPISAVLVCAVDFLVSCVLLAALMAWYGITPGLSIVAFPLVLLVNVLFAAAVGLVVAMANLFYRDVKYLMEAVLTVWMFATSVVYPVGEIGGTTGRLLKFNPMTPIVDAYRSVIMLGRFPDAAFFVVAVIAILMLGSAWLIFHRAEYQFAENI
jgi:lipopolysaccharide transport system permease protein